MKVNSISAFCTPKTTGYAAAAGVGLTVLSGISKNKNIRKTHKAFSFLTVLTTVLHFGLIEYYNYKIKGKQIKEL